ncbi:hypothetical protein CHS0354_024439 [Potamilus streckersoni]|uniref:ceramide glucosyltransferase n=1 Tax=Potamilus streckersoni TaxID=2493646 RepID=A0AAE0W3P2_9BIVA|nr:hypothetical protein CHS0354_024439 [Potamilus streckersoni]
MSIGQIFAFSIAVAICGGWIFVWIIHIAALLYGCRKLHKAPPTISPEDLQGVSIIKPLTGVDPNLFYNLETFFNLNFPAYEILFSVHDEHDPAIMVVQKLIEKYPKVDAKLFIGFDFFAGVKYIGPNGKVNNMMKPFEAAKYEWIVISDSGIKAEKDSLIDMASFMKPDVGLVLQMPYACTRKGFAGVYEKVYFGTMAARNCLSANSVGINCSTGMSCMVRKTVIEQSGGLASFSKYLAEDFFICEATKKLGYKVTLSNKLAMQNSGNYSLDNFHKRLIRWGQLRFAMLPTLIILEPLGECMFMGVLSSWAVEYLFGISSMAFFLMHVLTWFLLDYFLLRITENGPLPFSKSEFLVAWLLRECASFYLSMRCHGTSLVVWRHRKYRLRWGGTIEEI